MNGPAGIGVADLRGDVNCLSLDMSAPINIADRRYFRDALETRTLAVGDYLVGRKGGVPAIHFSRPIFSEDGTLRGVVFIPLNLEWLAQQLASSGWPEGSVVQVKDRNGTLLAAYPPSPEVGRRPAEISTSTNTVATAQLGAEHGALRIAVALPRAQVARNSDEQTRRSALLFGASALLGLVLAEAISRGLVLRPLRELERTAKVLEQGRYEPAAVGAPLRVAEFSNLAGSFDRLRQELHRREIESLRAQEELRHARDEALAASLSKTSFLASVSHDVRQPLHALSLTTSLLATKLRDDSLSGLTDRILRSVDGLVELVNSLFDVSQLDAGLVTPSFEAFAVADLWQRVMEDFDAAAASKDITLTVEPTDVHIRSDRQLLLRVIENLVANAIKYTPAGGSVTLSAKVTGEEAELAVADNGQGIPHESQVEVWEEFRQLSNPERDSRRGLGLGLAIVRRTVALLRHSVSLVSAPGQGTVVRVRVPIARPKPAQPSADLHTSLSGTVLLVEDNAAVRASTSALLSEWGLRIEEHATAETAFSALERASHFDGVLADYRLPGRSGLDVISTARSRWPSIVAILVTADLSVLKGTMPDMQGITVVAKPISVQQLREALQRLASPRSS